MQDIWNRILKTLASDWPSLVKTTKEPVSVESWTDFEDSIGALLPESFKQFYAVRNGEETNLYGVPCGLIFGQHLLSQANIFSQWKVWNEIVEESSEEELAEDFMDSQSVIPGAIKETYANSKWIPFTCDQNGNHVGIDLDPDVKGVSGQIISFGTDVELKHVLAPSFGKFIDWFLAQLESGNYLFEKTHPEDDAPRLTLDKENEFEAHACKHFYP